MLMQNWDPNTTPGTVMLMLALVVGIGAGRILFRIVTGWVESSLDIPYQDARNTVLILIPIGLWVIFLLSLLLGVGLVSVAFPLTFSVCVVAQTGVFSWRHTVSLRRSLLFSLAIAAIPIIAIALAWCTVFVVWKALVLCPV